MDIRQVPIRHREVTPKQRARGHPDEILEQEEHCRLRKEPVERASCQLDIIQIPKRDKQQHMRLYGPLATHTGFFNPHNHKGDAMLLATPISELRKPKSRKLRSQWSVSCVPSSVLALSRTLLPPILTLRGEAPAGVRGWCPQVKEAT